MFISYSEWSLSLEFSCNWATGLLSDPPDHHYNVCRSWQQQYVYAIQRHGLEAAMECEEYSLFFEAASLYYLDHLVNDV